MPKREKIPVSLSDRVLFECNRTCCICQTPGKTAQIHHIDHDSSNNDFNNLIVVCLECHSDIHTKKSFGRNWTVGQLKKYKDEWTDVVKKRRSEARKNASFSSVTGEGESIDGLEDIEYKTAESLHLLKIYLEKLPKINKGQFIIASAEWDHPNPLGMVFGFTHMIDFYEAVLVELSTFYPKGHFENKNPRIYFSEQVSVRTSFALNKLGPYGPYMGYSTDRDISLDDLTREIKDMVAKLAEQLISQSFDFDLGDYETWSGQWNEDFSDI